MSLSSYLVMTPSLDDRADLVPTAWMEAQRLCPSLRHHSWAVTGLLKAACLPSAQRQRARVSSLTMQKAAQSVYSEPALGLAPTPHPASLPSRYLPDAQECCNFRTPRAPTPGMAPPPSSWQLPWLSQAAGPKIHL